MNVLLTVAPPITYCTVGARTAMVDACAGVVTLTGPVVIVVGAVGLNVDATGTVPRTPDVNTVGTFNVNVVPSAGVVTLTAPTVIVAVRGVNVVLTVAPVTNVSVRTVGTFNVNVDATGVAVVIAYARDGTRSCIVDAIVAPAIP